MLTLPAGDLENLVIVGRGGFGFVYKGWSRTLKMEIALKMIQGAQGSSIKTLMKDLMKERDVMQKASNPHVLRLLGMYEKQEGIFTEHGLVMEYMPNGSLHTLFDKMPNVPWPLRFQILHQVSLGMNYLHSLNPPIIHRDLKPGNVLLNKYLDVQITDFGLSKIGMVTSSAEPSCAGTLSYMAPEALSDLNYKPTKAFDVYSYGILIWTVFSGEEPYNGVPSGLILQHVPKGQRPQEKVLDQLSEVKMVSEAKELMTRCWSGNAEERPSFSECSESTRLMVEEYKEEMVNTVRTVQDHLNQLSVQDQMSNMTGSISNISDSFFNRVLEAIGGTAKELHQPEPGSESGHQQISSAKPFQEQKSEEEEEEDKMSTADKALRNITEVIQNSGDYKKILNKLSSDGIVTQEDRAEIESSQSLKDLGQSTEKLFREKPLQVISSLWDLLK